MRRESCGERDCHLERVLATVATEMAGARADLHWPQPAGSPLTPQEFVQRRRLRSREELAGIQTMDLGWPAEMDGPFSLPVAECGNSERERIVSERPSRPLSAITGRRRGTSHENQEKHKIHDKSCEFRDY